MEIVKGWSERPPVQAPFQIAAALNSNKPFFSLSKPRGIHSLLAALLLDSHP